MDKQPEGMTQPRQSRGDYCVIPEEGNDGNTEIVILYVVTPLQQVKYILVLYARLKRFWGNCVKKSWRRWKVGGTNQIGCFVLT